MVTKGFFEIDGKLRLEKSGRKWDLFFICKNGHYLIATVDKRKVSVSKMLSDHCVMLSKLSSIFEDNIVKVVEGEKSD